MVSYLRGRHLHSRYSEKGQDTCYKAENFLLQNAHCTGSSKHQELKLWKKNPRVSILQEGNKKPSSHPKSQLAPTLRIGHMYINI